MKRVLPLMLLGILVMFDSPVFSAPLGAYYQVMQAVYARDESSLKYLVSNGLNINATNVQGKTALCTAVENQDYEGYELLLSQGATTRTPCMRDMNPDVLNRFVAEQPPLGTYYEGAVLTASRNGALVGGIKDVATTIGSLPYPHLGEILLGGVAVGTAFAVGVHGSSGGEEDKPKNDYVFTSPFENKDSSVDNYLSPDYFSNPTAETLSKTQKGGITEGNPENYRNEYAGGLWNWEDRDEKSVEFSSDGTVGNINFLSVLNADDAYARGYSGSVINRDNKGNLSATGWDAVSDKKVKVAVMDTGLFYHTDLSSSLYKGWVSGSTYQQSIGLNYEYGVFSEENNSSYWNYVSTFDDYGNTELYKEGQKVLEVRNVNVSDWDNYRGKFAPVCGFGTDNDGNCLKQPVEGEDDYYEIQYVSGFDTDDEDTVATYYIYPNLWDEYVEKYGSTGYVYDATNATSNFFSAEINDDIDHGTHVAGIIGALRNASGMQGIAYNAEILPVKIDFDRPEALPTQIAEVADKAKIINLSIGDSNHFVSNDSIANSEAWNNWLTPYRDDYLKIPNKGAVQVFAAGNEEKAQPTILAAAPLVNSAFKNLVISVVALGGSSEATYHKDTGDITSYSNRCGATAEYCLAAPGGGANKATDGTYTMTTPIVSTGTSSDNIESAYKGYVGTSMAAPMVSGSLAVIMGAFPFLKPQQAVQILFDTANYIEPTEDEITAYNELASDENAYDENAYAVNTVEGKYNAIYGHGLVDLEAATNPIGLPKITFDTTATSSNSVVASASSAHVSSTVAGAVKALPENLIVLDDYSRAYPMSTSRFIQTEKRSDSLRRSFRSFMAQDEKQVGTSEMLSFAFSEAPSDKKSVQTGSMSMVMRPNKNIQMRLGFTEDTASFGGSYVGRSLQNPFMNMRQAFGVDASVQFAKNWALTSSWISGKNGFVDEDIFDKMADQSRMQLIESGVAYQGIENMTLGVSGGFMNEEDSLFGTRGAGAFETNGAETRFVRVVANYQPTDKFRLSGAYTYGMTEADKTNSLMSFSRLTSDSFALTAEYMPDDQQTFGIKLVSPLRVRSGSVAFNLPVARDLYEDRVYRENYTASLKPEAREYDIAFFYANQFSSDVFWAGETGLRLNPDHQSQEPDYRALFKLNWSW